MTNLIESLTIKDLYDLRSAFNHGRVVIAETIITSMKHLQSSKLYDEMCDYYDADEDHPIIRELNRLRSMK